MTKRDDGGPMVEAMTLRDHFAAQAMIGILAYPGDVKSGSWHNNATAADVAAKAYEYADAMLAERGKK